VPFSTRTAGPSFALWVNIAGMLKARCRRPSVPRVKAKPISVEPCGAVTVPVHVPSMGSGAVWAGLEFSRQAAAHPSTIRRQVGRGCMTGL